MLYLSIFALALALWYWTFSPLARWKRRAFGAAVLDVIREQQPNGTGYTLTKGIEAQIGYRSAIAEIYSHLSDLQRSGTVSSRWGQARDPGGPRPRHYWITADFPDLAHDGGRRMTRPVPTPASAGTTDLREARQAFEHYPPLKEAIARYASSGYLSDWGFVLHELNTVLTTLAAENEALRAALKPFDRAADIVDENCVETGYSASASFPGDLEIASILPTGDTPVLCRLSDLYAARSALTPGGTHADPA